ncbi:sporozoite invasion-associated protein 1, putative, partial [Hepatocystis sp. ex Piliocolobus tephrosceles]
MMKSIYALFLLAIATCSITSARKVSGKFKGQNKSDLTPFEFTEVLDIEEENGDENLDLKPEDFSFNGIRKHHVDEFSFLQTSVNLQNLMHDKQPEHAGDATKYIVTGKVIGLVAGKPLNVVIAARYANPFDFLYTTTITTENPTFKFELTRGMYYLRTYGDNYLTPSAIKLNVPCADCNFVNPDFKNSIKVEYTEGDKNKFVFEYELQKASSVALEHINTTHKDQEDFEHNISLDSNLELDVSGAAATLKTFYGIELVGVWGYEFSERLLNVLSSFPECLQLISHDKAARDSQRKHQRWILSDEDLGAFDLEVVNNHDEDSSKHNEDKNYSKTVKISKFAFSFSRKYVKDSKKNGKYFSRRLEKLVIRLILENDYNLFKTYFKQKHGVVLLDPSRDAAFLEKITGYSSEEYQPWNHNVEEMIELATSWDEYPKGLQTVKGLGYLSRRKNGLKHPRYPTAPAVAFPAGQSVES